MGDNSLLVLGVIEGRRFPKRPHHKLVIEAKFDGEALLTDAIRHTDFPKFNTELAWEIDKKSFHLHKMQRTPVKIQVYAIENNNEKKELIGYCVLDIRRAHLPDSDKKKKSEWHSLLSRKYQSSKPEINLMLSVEADQLNNNNVVQNTTENNNTKQMVPGKLCKEFDMVLSEEKGYYVIGSPSDDCSVFTLSISVGGGKNLVQLLSSDVAINAEDGFFFYYSLFDNDVTNETFYDLMSATIPTERATVRVFATAQNLTEYLKHRKSIEVFLCTGDNSLGKASVHLDTILADSMFKSPQTIDGVFPVTTMEGRATDATLGATIVLRREDPIVNLSPVLAPRETPQYKATEEKQVKEAENVQNAAPKQQVGKQSPKKQEKPVNEEQLKLTHAEKKQQTSLPTNLIGNLDTDNKHHYSFSIDLRSFSNKGFSYPLTVVCRYCYPFFGSSAPIMTHPPVAVARATEALLPNSFCKFEFAATPQALYQAFTRIPLVVEVWHKDVNTKDQLVGVSHLFLSQLLHQEGNKKSVGPRIWNSRINVMAAENLSTKVGSIHTVLGLEDRGIVAHKISQHNNLQNQPVAADNTLSEETVTTATDRQPATEQPGNDNAKTECPRDTTEYQVAMALEMWKHQQEEMFNNQLASKESERMKLLAEEWKQRDLHREALTRKKIEEYTNLENKLRQSLLEVEKHQEELNKRDAELTSRERALSEDYNLKMNGLEERLRRQNEEHAHALNMEAMRRSDLEQRHASLAQALRESEAIIKEREQDVYRLKESALQRPDVKLQSDLHLLMMEKSELERKLEAVGKSKVHYKQQWGRALRELARLKTSEQEAAKTRLKQQQHEIEHMKLRYFAAEEKKLMGNERDEILQVKEELSKKIEELKLVNNNSENNNKNNYNTAHNNNTTPDRQEPITNDTNGHDRSRIAKLIEERDTLLQTGVYSMQDRVITELDREIQQIIAGL